MRVVLDTNILLDVLLDRAPWVDQSKLVWKAHDEGRVDALIAAVTPPNIFYVVRRIVDVQRARECVRISLEAFQVLPLDRPLLRAAFDLGGKDFEDDVHIACASAAQIDAIVTRDQTDFAASPVPVWTPDQLLANLQANP